MMCRLVSRLNKLGGSLLANPMKEFYKLNHICRKISNSLVANQAPRFEGKSVFNKQFCDLSSDSFKGKYLVLFFYPLDFRFVCPTEICAFSDRFNEFRDINCDLVAVSTDSHFSHLAWINQPRNKGGLGDVNIHILSDTNHKISKDYCVFLKDKGFSQRGLYIIDDKNVVRHSCVNDFPIGRSVDETLRLVKAIQYFEKHGEVCPANWKPGNKSINKLTFFKRFFTYANTTRRHEKSLNSVQLIGRVGTNVESSTNNNSSYFSFATSRTIKNKETGEFESTADWHRVVITKEYLKNYVDSNIIKGDRLFIRGSINYYSYYKDDNSKHTITSILADDILFLKRKQVVGSAENTESNFDDSEIAESAI
ncbi:hypothetical protein A3Q56_05266 [Intoshia linei]|uniref:Thioredoxin peroxidase n=1 Tax=Intoshia linei TaxID=1819745 RepID=A0A177AYM9_9BILA|nr:hypothetical protein A3Q56_05266 [Intoshia linei]